jgi:hypothetical protein
VTNSVLTMHYGLEFFARHHPGVTLAPGPLGDVPSKRFGAVRVPGKSYAVAKKVAAESSFARARTGSGIQPSFT